MNEYKSYKYVQRAIMKFKIKIYRLKFK